MSAGLAVKGRRVMDLLKPLLDAQREEVPPPGVPDAYLGVWRRHLLETPGGRDTDSRVHWLQARHWHADLRIPADRPAFAGITQLAECDDAQLAWLASQQGFCGVTQVSGECCTWHRQVDFQPASGRRDVGRMAFAGECVVETGVEDDYREEWERLPESRGGGAVLELVVEAGELAARRTWLLVAGACFVYVRARPQPLPRKAADLSSLIAAVRPSRAQLLDWLDFEISFGQRAGPDAWRIQRSTLPFREGQAVTAPGAIRRVGHQLALEDAPDRRWLIRDWSLEGL